MKKSLALIAASVLFSSCGGDTGSVSPDPNTLCQGHGAVRDVEFPGNGWTAVVCGDGTYHESQ